MNVKRTARTVGVLYLIATAAGMIGLGFEDPILNTPDYLLNMSANENQVIIATLLELVMAVAVSGIAIAIYPVLKQHNISTAIGYFGARLVESVIYIVGVISLLTLLTLSHEFVEAGAPDASYFQTLSEILLAVRDWGGHVVVDLAVFPLGALIFYILLYQTKLVPRWLSGIGLVGAVLYWAAGLLIAFSIIAPLTTPHIILQAPLGLQELVLAVWLIVKGFSPSAIAATEAT